MTELEALKRYIANDARNILYLENTTGAGGLERVALDAVVHWASAVELNDYDTRSDAALNLYRIAGLAKQGGTDDPSRHGEGRRGILPHDHAVVDKTRVRP